MEARSGNTLGTLLLSVPIAAVLLMAVFGIPRFAPGVNGKTETVWEDPRDFIRGMQGESNGDSELFDDISHPHDGDRRNPFNDNGTTHALRGPRDNAPSWNEQNGKTTHGDDPVTGTGVGYDPRLDGSRPEQMPFPGESGDTTPPQRTPYQPDPRNGVPQQITWTQARERLRDLNIEDYRLEPGTTPNEWLFVCQFVAGDDPNVKLQFENESHDQNPLTAVSLVLQQIDEYLTRRHAEPSHRLFPYDNR